MPRVMVVLTETPGVNTRTTSVAYPAALPVQVIEVNVGPATRAGATIEKVAVF